MNIQFYKDGFPLTMQVQQDDLLFEVASKYSVKIGLNGVIDNLNFYFNNQPLYPNSGKSLSEYQIYNGAVINVFEKGKQPFMPNIPNPNPPNVQFPCSNPGTGPMQMNILFAIIGRNVLVQGTPDMKFCELATRFCTKANISPNDQPGFILNSVQLTQDDQRTLRELKLRDQSRIEVVLKKDVIGA